MLKYSILIPVYNVERYLSQCLDSVLLQKYTNYEIILINDGSTDSSPDICQKYAEQYNRIKYISKENEGIFKTRIKLLQQAQGDYCIFLDSDDYWEPDALNSINDALEANPVDLLIFGYNKVSESGKLITTFDHINSDSRNWNLDCKDRFFENFLATTKVNYLWMKCIKVSIIKIKEEYLNFGNIMGEDTLLSADLILDSQKIAFLNKNLINYRINKYSMTANFKPQSLFDAILVQMYILKRIESYKKYQNMLIPFYANCGRIFTGRLVLSVNETASFQSWKELINRAKNYPIFEIALEYSNKAYNTNFKAKVVLWLMRKKRYRLVYLLAKIYCLR